VIGSAAACECDASIAQNGHKTRAERSKGRAGPRRQAAVKRLRRSYAALRSLRDDGVSSARRIASMFFW